MKNLTVAVMIGMLLMVGAMRFLTAVQEADPEPRVARAAQAGLPGVKLHPNYQAFAADEPRGDDVYRAIADHGLVLLAHCGRDFAFPPDDDRAAPHRFARVLDRHPSLRLVATHMGGYRMWDEVEQVLVGRDNVWLETSFSLGELESDRAADIIRRHGYKHVLFGTDWPWNRHDAELARLDALPLPDSAKNLIRLSNAAKLLGFTF